MRNLRNRASWRAWTALSPPSRRSGMWLSGYWGCIPLILIILLIVQLGSNNSPSTATSQATATAQALAQSQAGGLAGGATAAPQPATGGQNTSAPAPTVAAGGAAPQIAQRAGQDMTIDTAKGTIVCKLYTDASAGVSKTVANFETKAKAGYFNGLLFHRVEDWVIRVVTP